MARRRNADERKLHAVDVVSEPKPVVKPVADSLGLKIIWPEEPKPWGNWFELVPGPSAPREQRSGWVSIDMDCWERFLEGPARYALPGYDPWGEATHGQESVDRFCMLLTSLQGGCAMWRMQD